MDFAIELTAIGIGIATIAVSVTAIGIIFGMYREITKQTSETTAEVVKLSQKVDNVYTTLQEEVNDNSRKIDEIVALSDSFNEKFGETGGQIDTLQRNVALNTRNIGALQSEAISDRDNIRRMIDVLQDHRQAINVINERIEQIERLE